MTLAETLARTTAEAKAAPTDASARMKLFRLFAVTGQWDRAATQLDTASTMDSSLGFTATVYRQAIACERFRAEVFAGRRTPVIAGEPPAWLAMMIEALRAGMTPAAAALRTQALDAATTRAGTLDGRRFEWIADADSRLGPIVETFIDGKYYWVPFERISAMSLPAPEDLLDKVWVACEMTFDAGGTKHVLLPVRYPGSESIDDEAIRLAGETRWEGSDAIGFCGLGQRVWTTDSDEFGLLDVRVLAFD